MVLTDGMVRDLAAFGPFFAVETHTPDSLPREPWHAMSELVDAPDVLTGRVLAVRTATPETAYRRSCSGLK